MALEHLLVEGLADVVGVALLDDALPDVVLAAEAQGDGYVELGEQPVDVRETAARLPSRAARSASHVALAAVPERAAATELRTAVWTATSYSVMPPVPVTRREKPVSRRGFDRYEDRTRDIQIRGLALCPAELIGRFASFVGVVGPSPVLLSLRPTGMLKPARSRAAPDRPWRRRWRRCACASCSTRRCCAC